jgi:predicted nucleic acid-binding protein
MNAVDASVLVTALGDDGDRARSRFWVEDRLMAPHLVDIELVSAWRRMTAAGDLAERRAELAIVDLSALRMDRVPQGPLFEGCWLLRANLTAYDAVYVALAEIAGIVLLTADSSLATSPALSCEVELLN